MTERMDVVVIGAGQAGLATSHELTRAGVEHVVLERGSVGQSWRGHWDSFCLVTPNWTVQLPGGIYDGDDPDGYLPRDEISAFLERYAASFDAPVRGGIEVDRLGTDDGAFRLRTSSGDITSRSVVVATGAYQRAYRPPGSSQLPDLPQLDAADYTNPAALPSGAVLLIGSGQSGCQIAEELNRAGRDVYLACGKAPWVPRRIGDHDVVWWVVETGFMDQRVGDLPVPAARLNANLLNTGRDGGHTLNPRTLRAQGVTLLGRFLGARGHVARFAPDLGESQAWGDARYREVIELVRGLVVRRALPMPDIPEPEPFDANAPEELDLTGFGAVVFTGGFRPDYGWIDVPAVVDDLGFPRHVDGASTAAPGLAFVGVHFLRKRKSSLLYGIGEDATIVADGVAARLGA
ncbi:MAG: flavin-containing monooxygenase [Actinomycetota bacterium]